MTIERCLWGAALAASVAASGCGGERDDAPADDWPDDGRWWVDGAPMAAAGAGGAGGAAGGPANEELASDVRRIFGASCAPCHAGRRGVVFGDFGEIFDVNEMRARGLIAAGDSSLSRLLGVVAYGEMPPGGAPSGVADPGDPSKKIPPVSPDDVERIAAWLAAGAPPLSAGPQSAPLSGAALRARLLDDLASVPAGDREHVRYVSLHSVFGKDDYDQSSRASLANVASRLLNRLSPTRPQAARPSTVLTADDELVALRVDLRDYDLDAADWARLEAATDVVDRQAFPCAVPFLDVDHLLGLAANDEVVRADGSRESVYSNVVLRRALERAGALGPGQLVFEPRPPGGAADEPLVSDVTLPQLAAALGVDLARDTALGGDAALRACRAASSSGSPARCAQRDAMAGGPGSGFWWTMDLPAGSDVDPVRDPVGPSNGGLVAGADAFSVAGGQALWPWPNGATGFAVYDDRLRLRSSGPPGAALPDEAGSGVGAVNSDGCLLCHFTRYRPMTDDLRWALDRGELDPAEAEFAARLARPQAALDAQGALDTATHLEALRASCVRGCAYDYGGDGGFVETYPTVLLTVDVARRLYLDSDKLVELVRGSAGADPELPDPNLLALGLRRAEFVAAYGALRRMATAAGVDEAALHYCALPAGADLE